MSDLLTKISDAGWPTIIAAVIALLGVFASAIIALSISRRATYLTSVTAERSKWIDKLRTNIADVSGICAYIHFKNQNVQNFTDTSEYYEILLNLEKLTALINLQLNLKGVIDQAIIEIVDDIYLFAGRKSDSSVYEAESQLIQHAQWLLKEEWETVKWEASGLLRRIVIAVKRWRRARAYKAFCSGNGSLVPLREARSKSDSANPDS